MIDRFKCCETLLKVMEFDDKGMGWIPLSKEEVEITIQALKIAQDCSWKPIELHNSFEPVIIIDALSPIMHRAVAYLSNNEWLVLNSNEDDEGSEVIQWEPTHFIPFPTWQKIVSI